MLRLTLSRAPRRVALSSAARWSRFNSNQTTRPRSNAAEKSGQKQKQKSERVTAQEVAKPVKDDVYEATAEETISFEELERELNDIEPHKTDFIGPEKVAETEAEMFGTASTSKSSPASNNFLDPKLMDPGRLPLRAPLPPDASEPEIAATLVHGRGIHLPYQHPRTHNIPVALVHFRSHHPKLLELFTHFASHAASSLGIPVSRVASLPTQRSLWTVLRSPFVHKKRQENFERKVHKRAIKAWDADPEVVERWAKYLRRHAMGGVGMRIVKWERVPVGVGRMRAEEVDQQLTDLGAMELPTKQKIRLLGQRIVVEEMNSQVKETPVVTAST